MTSLEPPWNIPEETWTVVPGDLSAVGEARRRAIATVGGWCPKPLPDDIADAIRRVVSELVANALRHAGDAGPITVSLWQTGRGNLAVTVADGSREPPILGEPYADGTAGRGLALVEADTITWGWQPTGDGKTVRATISLPGAARRVQSNAEPVAH